MRNETDIAQDSSIGVIPMAPWRVREVRPLESYRLHVVFMDGLEGFVDLSQLIINKDAGVFAALKDIQIFNSVHVNCGAVTWLDELDLAPDAMYDGIKEKGEWTPL